MRSRALLRIGLPCESETCIPSDSRLAGSAPPATECALDPPVAKTSAGPTGRPGLGKGRMAGEVKCRYGDGICFLRSIVVPECARRSTLESLESFAPVGLPPKTPAPGPAGLSAGNAPAWCCGTGPSAEGQAPTRRRGRPWGGCDPVVFFQSVQGPDRTLAVQKKRQSEL